MLRTCIGTEGSNAKDYPNFAENKIRFENGNGDIVSGRGGGIVSGHGGGHGSGHGRLNQWGEGGATDIKEALSELLPEEIPGLPRHRPGEFSPRYAFLTKSYYTCHFSSNCKLPKYIKTYYYTNSKFNIVWFLT